MTTVVEELVKLNTRVSQLLEGVQISKQLLDSVSPNAISAASNAAQVTADKAIILAAKAAVDAAEDVVLAARDEAVQAKLSSKAAAESSGDIRIFDTFPEASAALPTLAEDQVIRVLTDGNKENRQSFYRKESGVLVFKSNISLNDIVFADETTAITGTDNSKAMSALQTKNAIIQRRKDIILTPEMFGAVGNGSLSDGTVGVNDIGAFVLAARAAKALGGARILLRRGAVYRIAYNTQYPCLILASNTTLDFGDSAYWMLDASLLPASSVYPSAIGVITTGNPDTGYRCGAGASAIAGTGNLVISGWNPAVDMVENVHILNARIRCKHSTDLGPNQRLGGIKLWFAYNSSIQNADVRGTPNSGIACSGGSNNVFRNLYAEDCGFNAATGTDRNGVSLFGYMITILSQPTWNKYSSRGWTVDGIQSHDNYHEGISFAGVAGMTISNGIFFGNLDRAVEGDTSFDNSETAVSRGQDIPGEYIISNIIADGRYRGTRPGYPAGTTSVIGVSVGCDNETRITLNNIRIRNINSTAGIFAVFANSGGRVMIDNVTLENIVAPTNHHLFNITMEHVRINNVTAINCTAANLSFNPAVIGLTNAKTALVSNVMADAGMYFGVRFDGTRDIEYAEIHNVTIRGLLRSGVRINNSGSAGFIKITDTTILNLGSDASVNNAFLMIANAGFRCDTIIVENTYFRSVNPMTYAITEDSGVVLATGAIKNLIVRSNNWDAEKLTMTSSFRSYNRDGMKVFSEDHSNGFLGQQFIYNHSLPTTGTYAVGDTLRRTNPSAGGTSEMRCVASGTYGTLTSVTGSGNNESTLFTVNTVTDLKVNNFISIVGITGLKRILRISGNTLTLDSALDATVSGAAVAFSAPVWKAVTLAA